MKTLTHNGLVEMLENSLGTLIVGLRCLTDARVKKTGNPFPEKRVFKQIAATGFVGVDYEKSVNREADRQGATPEFQAEQLPFGTWLVPNKVISHTNKEGITKLYLRTQTTPGQRRKQPARVICYRDINGQFLSREAVKPFLPTVIESNKQQEETGIDSTVWVRTYAFDSIQRIRIAGQTYVVKH